MLKQPVTGNAKFAAGADEASGSRLPQPRVTGNAGLTLTFALSVFLALTTANVALAQVQPGPTNFPMVGITGAQTLQLNLIAYPPVPCSPAQLGFQNRNGVAVGPSETTPALQPGQSISLAVNGSFLVAADQRVELLPTVTGMDGAATGASCVASVEVIDNANGVTTVLGPGAFYPPEPTSFPPTPLGMLGVTAVETVRLNVVAFPPTPCIGTIGFVDKNGTPIGASMAVQLGASQATHLDLPGGGALGPRAEVRPVVAVSSGSACIASVEVYSKQTGRTIAVYWPPQPN